MEISLNALVERIDDHLFERGTREYRLSAGLAVTGERPSLDDLGRADTFQYLNELIASPRTDEGKRGRLVLLRRYVARSFLEHAAGGTSGAIDAALHGPTFFAAARTWTLGEALKEGSKLATREARADLDRGLATALEQQSGAWARRVDVTLQAATALGQPMASLVELMQGRALQPRLEAATRLLKQTDDAYLDLLTFALKRLDPQLNRRNASALDVERAAQAPWLYEAFRREDLAHAVTRCVTDLGFNPSAEGRLTVDAEPRPGRIGGAHVFELRVPGQVRLLLTADLGFETYAAWLRAWGIALHRVHVGRALPLVERRLGDPAVIDAVGRLFESFLLEEGWLKRYLRLGSAQAREAARMFAFRQLLALRRSAALALVHPELCARGAVQGLEEQLVPRVAAAMGGEQTRGRTFLELDPLAGHALELDGWALEDALVAHLKERFNEDFYRNPAAGRWLVDLAARGQRDDAAVVAAQLNPTLALSSRPVSQPEPAKDAAKDAAAATPALDVTSAGRRRVALMGA